MSLRHALLGLLAAAPASGYELTKQFEISLGNAWGARHSQIYPELRRLAEEGLLEAGDEGARGRKEYTITPEGREELRRWLVETEPDRSARNEALLRVFFLWVLPDDEAAAYLEGEAKTYRTHLDKLDEIDANAPWGRSPAARMFRITLEEGRRWAITMADWAEWAAREIRAGRSAVDLQGMLEPSARI